MKLTELIAGLSASTAYPHAVDRIVVRQTHISVVFLAGPVVYKIKKPVNLGFLDFSSLEQRLHFCEQEVELNRRLAPDVYRGVVPVVPTSAGLAFERAGVAVEWAVKMTRLPDEATLQQQLQRGEVTREVMVALAERIATFHARAKSGPEIATYCRFDAIARNARENFEQSAMHIGRTVSRSVYDRVQALTEDALARLRTLIEARADRGMPRDTHGDLRLDHVYTFAGCAPPNDLVIIDCIEFNERFRYADPVADMAFLVMDLGFHGRRDLAQCFADAYFRAAGDIDGRAMLSFFTAYRAVVRGKVEGMELSEFEIPEVERAAALARSRGHWIYALGELESPGRRPALILIGGLPGTGKSTLARALAQQANFTVIRSDVVRKQLSGLPTHHDAVSAFGTGIYSREWTDRTYAECLRQAEQALFDGQRVIVDATFGEEIRRQTFLTAAQSWGVVGAFLECRAEEGITLARLDARRGDASDADRGIYIKAAAKWEPVSSVTAKSTFPVSTDGPPETMVEHGMMLLKHLGLADER